MYQNKSTIAIFLNLSYFHPCSMAIFKKKDPYSKKKPSWINLSTYRIHFSQYLKVKIVKKRFSIKISIMRQFQVTIRYKQIYLNILQPQNSQYAQYAHNQLFHIMLKEIFYQIFIADRLRVILQKY